MKTLLGIVTGVRPDKNKEPVAWVKPLLDVTGAKWSQIDLDDYPKRGYLFWPRATEAIKDAFVFVRPKENNVLLPDTKDDFMVVEPRLAFEVLDLRSAGSEEQIRRLAIAGIRLSGSIPSRTLIWSSDKSVVGPIAFTPGPNGVFTIEKNSRHRIAFFRLAGADIRPVEAEGVTRYVVARPVLGTPDGYLDWDEDRQVVKRAVEYAVDLARSSGSAVELSKQLIEDAAEQITRRGSASDLQLEQYRLERSRALFKQATQSIGISSELIALLQKHPDVVREFEQIKVAEREAARSEAEVALKTEHEELDALKKERAGVESALAESKTSLSETEALVKKRVSDIEGQIHRRVEEAVRNAPALLAEVAVLRPFLGGTRTRLQQPEVTYHPTWNVGANKLSTLKELRLRLIPEFKAAGLSPTLYQPLHAAFAAGLLPVLAGGRALGALEAYAHVAAAGRILIVSASANLGEARDLFGRVDLTGRRFVPESSGLIDVIRAARKSQGLMLVVIEGANRGATESYLVPLMRAVRRGSSFALFHPSAVAGDDPYHSEARIEWPKNLLLSATLVEGPTTLPVAPDLWSDGVLVQTDIEDAPASSAPIPGPTESSEIVPGSALLSAAKPGPDFHSEWNDGAIAPARIREVLIRFESSLSGIVSEKDALRAAVAKAVLVPFFASISNEDERESMIEAARKLLEEKNSEGLSEWVQAARRRVA